MPPIQPRSRPLARPSRGPLFAALAAGLAVGAGVLLPPLLAHRGSPTEPRARTLHRAVTAQPRLAGTSGSLWGARVVARILGDAGWDVEIETRDVLLSLPRRLELEVYERADATRPLVHRIERFDPDAKPPGDVPPFNAWSRSGEVRAPVVDVGRGLRADYERLAAAGVDVRGAIAMARYGGSYRGVKVALAAEHGCVGVLLVNDPRDDGAEKGAVWPAGPWKPRTAVQRGSILPMSGAPGDPSTPGWASPLAGEDGERLEGRALAARLPELPCLPVRWEDVEPILAHLTPRALEEGAEPAPVGPGPAVVRLDLVVPIDERPVRNVIATLRGERPEFVLAGNHRDAWVRGGVDAGSGTVTLLRAAERLAERVRGGWTPPHTIRLAFWDAEESGLIGSTEWGEAHGEELARELLVYVNCDAVVGGTRFGGASGTPGARGLLEAAAARIPAVGEDGTLLDQWTKSAGEKGRRLGLSGSGSDFAVFVHHLGLPALDIGLGGNPGGEYHTAFDGHAYVDRLRDPTWEGHETAGHLVAELLFLTAERGRAAFDEREAATRLAAVAREGVDWLGAERSERLAGAFETLAAAAEAPAPLGDARFYRRLAAPAGLAGRPWFTNRLWAPGLESGYGSETFPSLRRAAAASETALDVELSDLLRAIERMTGERGAP